MCDVLKYYVAHSLCTLLPLASCTKSLYPVLLPLPSCTNSLCALLPLPSCSPPSRSVPSGLLWHDWSGDVLCPFHRPALGSRWPGPAPPAEARHPHWPRHPGQAPSATSAVPLRHPRPGLPTPDASLHHTLQSLLQSAVSATSCRLSSIILRGSVGLQVGLAVVQE